MRREMRYIWCIAVSHKRTRVFKPPIPDFNIISVASRHTRRSSKLLPDTPIPLEVENEELAFVTDIDVQTDFEDIAKGREFKSISMILATGWLVTNIALEIAKLPMNYLLKDQLHLDAAGIAMFFLIGIVLLVWFFATSGVAG